MTTLIPFYTQQDALERLYYIEKDQQPSVDVGDDRTPEIVRQIIKDVREQDDETLYALAKKFGDALQPHEPIRIGDEDIQSACDRVPAETKKYIDEAAKNIESYCQLMMNALPTGGPYLLTQHGYETGFRLRPVERAACYVPAGRYPLVSSAMMTAITAKAAGVPHRVMLCANPKDEILYIAKLAGIQSVFKVGGAQALAAVAYGTTQIPKVDMVVGPGNRFVNEAKKQLNGVIGIDLLAGPSEVYIVADESCNADWIASDILAQAEHDPDARAYLLTTSQGLANAVQVKVSEQLEHLDLPDFVANDSIQGSGIFVLKDVNACIHAVNQLAPEHLHLQGESILSRVEEFNHYGTLFVGDAATVAHGDYCAGPNHTLPTAGTARFASALSPLSFLRVQNIVTVPEPNAYLNDLTAPLAKLESLTAHAHSVNLR